MTSTQANPARKLFPIQWKYRRNRTGLGTKITVTCANTLMAKVKTSILNKNALKLLVWKPSIDIIWDSKHMMFLKPDGNSKSTVPHAV